MSFFIAMAGKGGTGKTTVAGLIIRSLLKKGKAPVLAVDADANCNLNEVLGVGITETIGKIREEMLTVPAGMTKDAYIGYRVQEALVESEGFDLIAMGRPEGAGCYCYANVLCKKYVDILADNYNYVVVDNEAGLEHMSRRTTHGANLMVVVTDASQRGVVTAARIRDLAEELKLKIDKMVLVLNRVVGDVSADTKTEIEKTNLVLGCVLPSDDTIREFDEKGITTLDLGDDNRVVKLIDDFVDSYILK
jgi:CO dehydrogenase maturation factor